MATIAFDGTIFGLQKVGGISTYSWEILCRLAEAPNLRVMLGLPSHLLSDRAKQLEKRFPNHRRELLTIRAARYLPTHLYGDIVHSTYYRIPFCNRARYIVTVYDFVYERYRTGIARMAHSWQKRRACEMANAILCISENTRADLLNTYQTIDPRKVMVTPLAVDHQTFFKPSIVDSNWSDWVVYVGQRQGYKRFDLAVEAIALTGLKLVIVGQMPNSFEIELLDRCLKGRWKCVGRVNNADLRRIYAGAYAFIYPSDYEGFGLTILEAQASGCPAILANRSSFPEVGGAAALYAKDQTPEAYAACLSEIGTSDKRSSLSAKGIINASKFDWDKTFDLTLSAYARVLEEN